MPLDIDGIGQSRARSSARRSPGCGRGNRRRRNCRARAKPGAERGDGRHDVVAHPIRERLRHRTAHGRRRRHGTRVLSGADGFEPHHVGGVAIARPGKGRQRLDHRDLVGDAQLASGGLLRHRRWHDCGRLRIGGERLHRRRADRAMLERTRLRLVRPAPAPASEAPAARRRACAASATAAAWASGCRREHVRSAFAAGTADAGADRDLAQEANASRERDRHQCRIAVSPPIPVSFLIGVLLGTRYGGGDFHGRAFQPHVGLAACGRRLRTKTQNEWLSMSW